MGEVTLNVPAEHVEAFRLAVVHEIGDNASWVAGVQEELAKRLASPANRPDPDPLADVRGAARYLAGVMELAEQVFAADRTQAVEVSGYTEHLAHVAEAMASKVVTPKLNEATDYSPYEGDVVTDIHTLTKSLEWAAGKAEVLHERRSLERKAGAV